MGEGVFSENELKFFRRARVGHLAMISPQNHPHVLPVCFALVNEKIVTPLDEKAKRVHPTQLQRVKNIRYSSGVSLVVDRYREDWNQLGWVQIRGKAHLLKPGKSIHPRSVNSLRKKYEQYRSQNLDQRPLIHILPQTVLSWGSLESE